MWSLFQSNKARQPTQNSDSKIQLLHQKQLLIITYWYFKFFRTYMIEKQQLKQDI